MNVGYRGEFDGRRRRGQLVADAVDRGGGVLDAAQQLLGDRDGAQLGADALAIALDGINFVQPGGQPVGLLAAGRPLDGALRLLHPALQLGQGLGGLLQRGVAGLRVGLGRRVVGRGLLDLSLCLRDGGGPAVDVGEQL